MSKSICSVANCQREAKSRGWCPAHYNRWYRNGDVRSDQPIVERPPFAGYKMCAFPECRNRAQAKGYCSSHLAQLRSGRELAAIKYRSIGRQVCEFPNCERPAASFGICGGHAIQRRKGHELTPLKVIAPPGQGNFINNNGYRMVRGKLEHRSVMEAKLGRDLSPDETVHHINGIKTDNRPDNLELWVSRHPRGQRVVDVLDWAREMINRYSSEESIL